MKTAVAKLLRQTLSTTSAFQHDPDEVDLWLRSLPTTKRAPDATAPDGTPLTDEGEAVIALLDDCLQRCIKTPYRYLEELQTLCMGINANADMSNSYDPALLPSPMLATVLEQVQAKINGNLLSPSDTLAAVTFVRKLLVSFACKVSSLQVLDGAAQRVRSLTVAPEYYGESVRVGVEREGHILLATLRQLAGSAVSEPEQMNHGVDELITQAREASFGELLYFLQSSYIV
jgi:nucleolar pre-ribosomal-associated protein 1